jgi:hypothetical protein
MRQVQKGQKIPINWSFVRDWNGMITHKVTNGKRVVQLKETCDYLLLLTVVNQRQGQILYFDGSSMNRAEVHKSFNRQNATVTALGTHCSCDQAKVRCDQCDLSQGH